jgi:glycosyltransferase involved in cell wall biosynthesis
MKKPFFSVIICTYNRKNLICRAINSLLNQIEEDWEAIIIDDGSTDGSFGEIEPLIKNNDNFLYVFCSHQGVSNARNQGIRVSKGEFITFLDSDDEYTSNHLLTRKETLEANPEIELLHGGLEIIGNPYVPDITNPGKMIQLSECVVGGTFFIKRTVFDKVGFFPDVPFGEDYHFLNKAVQNGVKIAKVDYKTYIYHRDNVDSICNQIMNING